MIVFTFSKKNFAQTTTVCYAFYFTVKQHEYFVTRNRSEEDDPTVIVKITESGEKLKESAKEIPLKVAGCVGLEAEEAKELYKLLYKILGR